MRTKCSLLDIMRISLLVLISISDSKAESTKQHRTENSADTSTFTKDKRALMVIWRYHHHHHPTPNTNNCTLTEFLPPDFLTEQQRAHGGILLHIAITIYVCIAIAIVCHYYFVPALEAICYYLRIQEDVGGATLLCIGSSLPDIVSSVMAIMLHDEDLGVGTIMGTGVFNSLFVVGCCGVVCVGSAQLTWWPVVRDISAYMLSIVLMFLVVFDSRVTWYEAVAMVVLYCCYFVVLLCNKPIEMRLYLMLQDSKSYEARFEDVLMKKALLIERSNTPQEQEEEEEEEENEEEYCGYPADPPRPPLQLSQPKIGKILEEVFLFPIRLLFFVTIPDLRHPKLHKFFILTFLMSIGWIGLLTYLLLWMVEVIGATMGISQAIMGITLVTFGTSVPDLLCSVVTIRLNKPDMAIAQAVASNPLSILVGLGLPWLLKSAASGRVIVLSDNGALMLCGISLLMTLIAFLLIYFRRFVLDRSLGMALILGYVLYLVGSILNEIYRPRSPMCTHH